MGRLDRGGGHRVGVSLQGVGGTPEGESWFPPRLGCLPSVWPLGGAWPSCAHQHLLQSHHGPGSSFCRSTGFRVWGGGACGLVHRLVLGEEPGVRSIRAEKEPLSLRACPAAELGASFFAGSPPRGQLGVTRVLAGGPGGQPLLLPPDGPSSRVLCVHI